MTKQISRYCLRIGDAIQEADDGEWVRYRDVARFLPGYDRGREHPDTWPAVEPPAEPANIDDLIALGDKFILPVNVTIGAGTFRKGVAVGTMLRCLKNHAQYATATPYDADGLRKALSHWPIEDEGDEDESL